MNVFFVNLIFFEERKNLKYKNFLEKKKLK